MLGGRHHSEHLTCAHMQGALGVQMNPLNPQPLNPGPCEEQLPPRRGVRGGERAELRAVEHEAVVGRGGAHLRCGRAAALAAWPRCAPAHSLYAGFTNGWGAS